MKKKAAAARLAATAKAYAKATAMYGRAIAPVVVKRAARGKAALMSMYADILAEWYLKKRKEEKR